ncbi:LysR family transcriptional regulator [Shimia sp. R9_1]|uniref:LysR family transcriptional regulator n=1 Tax=Shimia sp. R9_1 TaxID=2821111 RepID=UPI001ADB0E8D|nr:LysR family transcriptional regulator [Shimia sp. R9_1]MBO9406839.1 LysR family transcriptional regulator [Shimia sp. R9_1]
MNLNSLDLNLLKAFDALYRERHVGRAGSAIGLAQPSMSNALNRLRARFGDPLFQRGPEGMVPTAKAEVLAPQIQEALQVITRMLAPAEFSPATLDAEVSIAAADLTVTTLAPKLMGRLRETAPGVRVSFLPLDKRSFEQELDDDTLTLALGTFGRLPARFERQTVLKDHFICITRKGFLADGAPMSLDTFVSARHALMTLSGGFAGAVDRALGKRGHSRQVVMTVTQFALLPDIIAQSDMISTIPASLAKTAERAGCSVYDPPLELPSWDIDLIHTRKTTHDPLGRFIGDVVRETLETPLPDA